MSTLFILAACDKRGNIGASGGEIWMVMGMSLLSANTKVWLYGLFAAFISTFSTSASGFLMLPTVFNFTHNGLINMVKVSALPAMVAVFGYLKASPLPPLIEPGDTATVQNPTIAVDGTITGTSATLKKKESQ